MAEDRKQMTESEDAILKSKFLIKKIEPISKIVVYVQGPRYAG